MKKLITFLFIYIGTNCALLFAQEADTLAKWFAAKYQTADKYIDNFNVSAAMLEYDKCLTMSKKSYGEKSIQTTEIFQRMGNNYRKMYKYAKAIDAYQRAMIANVKNFQNAKIETNPTVSNLEEILDTEKLVEALSQKVITMYEWYEKTKDISTLKICYSTVCSLDTIANEMKSLTVIEDKRKNIAKLANQGYEAGIQASLKLWKFKEAFLFTERNKSSILLQDILEKKAKQNAGIPQALLDKEQALKEEIAGLKSAMYQISLFKKKDSLTQEEKQRVAELKTQITLKQEAHTEIIKQYTQQYPKYRLAKDYDPVEVILRIQENLDEETAMIEYVMSKGKLTTFVITKQGFNVNVAELDSLDKYIRIFRITMRFNALTKLGANVSMNLYKILFNFVLPEHIKRLIIIPDDKLFEIPFEALTIEIKGEDSGSGINAKRAKVKTYLLEKYIVSYAYSSLLYLEQKSREIKTKGFAGIAPVSFQINSQLQSTKDEVINIDSLFKKYKIESNLYMYEKATRKSLFYALQNNRYVAIATLGDSFFSTLRSNTIDDYLFLDEVANVNCEAELLSLTSCKSGIGEYNEGEGVNSFARSFIYAGAKNILVSLTIVPDNQSIVYLMTEFYKELLNGNSIADALRQAKLNRYGDVSTWSGIILIGENSGNYR